MAPSNSPEPNASEWKRWEVHIHAPGTAMNDDFEGDWDGYMSAIDAADPPPVALGITDYCSISTYEDFLVHRKGRVLPKVELVFPNIEFRLAPATTKALPLNLHLLVSPEDPNHIVRIKEALGRLQAPNLVETITCDPAGLRRLGSIHLGPAAASSSPDDLYKAGVEQFKVDTSAFFDWYNKEVWLKANSIVVVAGGNDGLAGLRRDSGFKQYHDDLVRRSQFVFSAQPSDHEYFLGRGPDSASTISNTYGSLRPTLHGSDAHDIKHVLLPDLKRYCWIKAAVSFDGLRQLIYEPSERVHLGPEPPDLPDPARTISEILITDHDDWFATNAVAFNRQLNAVIGERGTGKTALADLLAAGTGSWQNIEGSFLGKATDYLSSATVTIRWGNGATQSLLLSDLSVGDNPQTRYLSQQFVERLCSGDSMARELLEEVERVVFDYIPNAERLNCSSFQDLREKLTESNRSERFEIGQELIAFNERIEKFRDSLAVVGDKRKKLDETKKETDRLQQEVGAILAGNNAAKIDASEQLRRQLASLEEAVAQRNEQLNTLSGIETKTARLRLQFKGIYAELKQELAKASVGDKDWPRFEPIFAGDVNTPILETKKRLVEQKTQFEGSADRLSKEPTVFSLQQQLSVEQEKLQLNELRKKKIAEFQKRVSRLQSEAKQLEQEIKACEEIRTISLPEAVEKRMSAYLRYFELLNNERKILSSLYKPLRDELSSRHSGERDLDFEVNTMLDISSWAARGESMLDLRHSGNYSQRGALEEAAKKLLAGPWEKCETEGIRNGINQLITGISEGDLRKVLRTNYTPRQIADWIFSVDHISLEYNLLYRGTPLRYLTPGTRGIVLLILYLALDKFDDRPLIVDQPEENLDNASVYDVLVRYFREAKQRRQIFVITHNPNLVVNTDAEQVIVANAERRNNGLPRISYSWGPLELTQNPGGPVIRESVCQILEGGKEAFRRREVRYDLSQ